LLALVPIYIAGLYFVGILDEVRPLNEVLPVLLTPLLLVFDHLLFPADVKRAGMAQAASSAQVNPPKPAAKYPKVKKEGELNLIN